jgi:Ca2+/Na+ antiporter
MIETIGYVIGFILVIYSGVRLAIDYRKSSGLTYDQKQNRAINYIYFFLAGILSIFASIVLADGKISEADLLYIVQVLLIVTVAILVIRRYKKSKTEK